MFIKKKNTLYMLLEFYHILVEWDFLVLENIFMKEMVAALVAVNNK